jgi:uncharacterized protein (DUF1778 family)
MMTQEAGRSARLEARIAPDVLAQVKHAAALQGRTVSDFVVDAVREAAHRAIEVDHVIRLSVADQERFAAALINPPEPNEALRKAAKAHAELVEVR